MKWFHLNCSDTSNEDVKFHNAHPDAIWLCPACDVTNFASSFFYSSSDHFSSFDLSNPFESLSSSDESNNDAVDPPLCRLNIKPKKDDHRNKIVTPTKLIRCGSMWKCSNQAVNRTTAPITIKRADDGWTVVSKPGKPNVDSANSTIKPNTVVSPITIKRADDGWTVASNPGKPNVASNNTIKSTTSVAPITIMRVDDGWKVAKPTTTSIFVNDDVPHPPSRNKHKHQTSHQDAKKATDHLASLKVTSINCQSIKGKAAVITALIETEQPDILIGTESWLDNSILTSEILTSGKTEIYMVVVYLLR
jgi:hypothetical protein